MHRGKMLGLIALVIFLGAGCNFFDSTTTPDNEITPAVIDLNSPTGGYTPTDENPAFGEEYKFELMGDEPLYGDPLENDDALEAVIRNRYAKVFRFRSIWGNLVNAVNERSAEECCAVDWTGGMRFEGGYILIVKEIGFDLNEEITRIDGSTIEWVSKTCPHVDGIEVKLVLPPGPEYYTFSDSSETETVTPALHIKAGPFERTFSIEELEAMHMVERTDRCGNGIMLGSHIIPPDCPNGYLFGNWNSTEPDSLFDEESGELKGVLLGVFRGVWFNEHGIAAGFLRGIAGTNSIGEQKFFGKYINIYGKYMGILVGDYGISPALYAEEPPFGWFKGKWLGRYLTREGALRGEWVSDAQGYGFFHGQWVNDCYFTD
ncbi:MAG: hypothetical protein JW746_06955 [Candidatus Krumholzibacteriota bacterium]|nr:hypothetical protein [Candidatus Krumholzibacteriota bacterium]